jgi:uncharacterized protein YjbJ (UPF0337 family)
MRTAGRRELPPIEDVTAMPWDEIRGDWEGLKERLRGTWGRLAEFELDEVDGDRDRLIDKIAEAYGIGREEADEQVREFEAHQRRRRPPRRAGDNPRRREPAGDDKD